MSQTLKEALIKIEKSLDGFATKRQMGIYARRGANLIMQRTRLGKGVDKNNGPQKALKKLGLPYKKQRAKGKPPLSPLTSKSKSNLTRTGELLSSIGGKGLGVRKALIYIKGKRNQDITEWQVDQGRRFLRFSRPEINNLARQIGNDLEKYINKTLN